MFHVGEEKRLVQIEKWVVLNTINEADGIEVTINNKKEVYFDGETTGYSLNQIEGAAYPGVSATDGLHILFDRASGAFVEKTNSASGSLKNCCSVIEVSGGNRTIQITTVAKTGKITK